MAGFLMGAERLFSLWDLPDAEAGHHEPAMCSPRAGLSAPFGAELRIVPPTRTTSSWVKLGFSSSRGSNVSSPPTLSPYAAPSQSSGSIKGTCSTVTVSSTRKRVVVGRHLRPHRLRNCLTRLSPFSPFVLATVLCSGAWTSPAGKETVHLPKEAHQGAVEYTHRLSAALGLGKGGRKC